jgi:hypothetical protein
MTSDLLQAECERGQAELMRMNYLEAEAILAEAERQAWRAKDWDSLSRLYMPLQEARRQRRQRCGEGRVCLDLIAADPSDTIDPAEIPNAYPQGQLLVAGWGTIAPALRVRQLAFERGLYLDTFLAAAYPAESGRWIAIVPLSVVALPEPAPRSLENLRGLLPEHTLIIHENDLPRGVQPGTYKTYGLVMDLWERLHAPFLAAADAQADPVRKMEGYRRTILVDYACELAHQKLSDVAKKRGR